uniref:Pimeloyl-ACP methyl ester carboxylesterase n=1 Tax=Candidatus Kentrum sp. FW TaxID=2126338 RepID=A0A450TAD1_9GAMM|nr:MAG: Pimeloyl-ACP methyl ester carboxylesterase [Candidatus Kentron sp. FW]
MMITGSSALMDFISIPTLAGIDTEVITTRRLTTRALFSGIQDGIPALFLHGNLISATCWEEVMLSLPVGYRAIAPDQRGYGSADPAKKIHATRGMGDLADDAVALLDYLGIDRTHFIGHSMGGSVIWRLLVDHPERFLTATLIAPSPPYGFGATKDASGIPCCADFAGSGAGLINAEMVKRLMDGDRSLDSPLSPRTIFRTLVFKPPFIPDREEELLSATLATHFGEQDFPGDFSHSSNWPYVAPGQWGPLNAMSPKYAIDVEELYAAQSKISILWIRGSQDAIISNHSAFDPAIAGEHALLPDWPGATIYPPQPMLDQTRTVLGKYAMMGGTYREIVLQDAGHMPYLEQLTAFNQAFHRHLESSRSWK